MADANPTKAGAPISLDLPQWREFNAFGSTAFSAEADAFNDMRVQFRILDLAGGADPLVAAQDAGTICIESITISAAPLDALRVSTPEQSAVVVLDILAGRPGAPRDHTLMNAGAALVVAGVADNLGDGVARAAQAIDSEDAMHTLERWRAIAGVSLDGQDRDERQS